MAEELRHRRRRHIGRSWHVDETFIKVHSLWRYLYRAMDRNGALVDAMLSERRDLAAAKALFRSGRTVTGVVPDRVTSDGHDASGEEVRHWMNVYLNNRLEQAIAGSRIDTDLCGDSRVAGRFCRSFDELRGFLRILSFHRQHVSAHCRRLRQRLRHGYCPRDPRSPKPLDSDPRAAASLENTLLARELTKRPAGRMQSAA